ncbi:MAG: phage portal protein [Deltaproteobacteria bacterium]|nr:phage portal protein [Deltaproteobacteria bacterium]
MNRPGIVQRARVALDIFRHGVPSPVAMNFDAESKAAPFIWPDWRLGKPQWKLIDYAAYVEEGFNLNTVIYSSIMYKVRSMTIAPLRAWEGDLENKEQLDVSHPLAQLVNRPNPHQSWPEFQGQGVVYLNISGNNFTLLDRPRQNALPEAMYNMRPDRVFIVPGRTEDGTYTVLGYIYVPEGKAAFGQMTGQERLELLREGAILPIMPQDMMHVKLPNPGDPLEGMGEGLSPISPMARSADVDNAVTHFLKLFFDRGVMVPGLLSSDNPLRENDIARFKQRWKEAYGGYQRWAEEIIVADRGIKYQRLGLTFDEMGFDGIDERDESRITGPFGVPPILIGARVGLKHATYSNYGEARRAFWQDTMVPESKLFEAEYQYYLQSKDGAFVAYDYGDVPALQEVALDQRTAWRMDFTAGAITREEYRQKIGMPPEAEGDYLIPLNLIEMPAGVAVALPAQDEMEEAPEAADDDRKLLPQSKAAKISGEAKQNLWKQVDGIAESWERRFGNRAVKAFDNDRMALLARVTKGKAEALEQKATVNWLAVQRDWDDYFENQAPENWAEQFLPVIQGVIEEQGAAWNAAFGMQFDVRNLFAEGISAEFFDDFMKGFSQDIIDTTQQNMGALIQQALEHGWTIDELTKQLDLEFARYTDPGFILDGRGLTEEEVAWFTDRAPRYRREMIARTETIRSSNGGSWALFNGWGVVEMKEWLATGDDRTRDTHLVAWGQYSEGGTPGPIPLNEAFNVGGSQLMFPGDPRGAAGEVVNCRCTLLPFFVEAAGTQEQVAQQQQMIEALVEAGQ